MPIAGVNSYENKVLSTNDISSIKRVQRACLHGVGDTGLVGLVSFVFTLLEDTKQKKLTPETRVPHSM